MSFLELVQWVRQTGVTFEQIGLTRVVLYKQLPQSTFIRHNCLLRDGKWHIWDFHCGCLP